MKNSDLYRWSDIENIIKEKLPSYLHESIIHLFENLEPVFPCNEVEKCESNSIALMTEEVKKALMRLHMCAEGACSVCKYEEQCDKDIDFRIELAEKNKNIILSAFKEKDEERKHGEWITYIDKYGIRHTNCSECGEDFSTYDTYGWKYCYKCGARMDKGDCTTCRFDDKDWSYPECDSCTKANSNYESRGQSL